jgi:hypothetical protein
MSASATPTGCGRRRQAGQSVIGEPHDFGFGPRLPFGLRVPDTDCCRRRAKADPGINWGGHCSRGLGEIHAGYIDASMSGGAASSAMVKARDARQYALSSYKLTKRTAV